MQMGVWTIGKTGEKKKLEKKWSLKLVLREETPAALRSIASRRLNDTARGRPDYIGHERLASQRMSG